MCDVPRCFNEIRFGIAVDQNANKRLNIGRSADGEVTA